MRLGERRANRNSLGLALTLRHTLSGRMRRSTRGVACRFAELSYHRELWAGSSRAKRLRSDALSPSRPVLDEGAKGIFRRRTVQACQGV